MNGKNIFGNLNYFCFFYCISKIICYDKNRETNQNTMNESNKTTQHTNKEDMNHE